MVAITTPKFPLWATDTTANEWLRGREGRRIVHSIYFREPEEYAGKIILIVVVGAGASDADIAMQSSGHAKKVRVWSSSPSTGVADGNVV